MSIATLAEVRAAVAAVAAELGHPFKAAYSGKVDVGKPHRFGRIAVAEGGQVGVSVAGFYLVARGESYEDSLYGLAHHLDLLIPARKDGVTPIVPDLGVPVEEVDAGWFWLFTNPEGKLPPEG